MEKVPVFTVTEPYCVFSAIFNPQEEKPKVLASRRSPYIINPDDTNTSIYVHGYAERLARFDIPRLIDGSLEIKEHNGLPCLLELENDTQIGCLLYTWPCHEGTSLGSGKKVRRMQGLIVSILDGRSIEYAEKCAAERRECL